MTTKIGINMNNEEQRNPSEQGIFSPQNDIKKECKFGKWAVSKSGDMSYDNGKYEIGDNRLKEDDWIAHMFEKAWIDWNDFMPAYFQALKNAGIKFKSERVFY